MSHMGNDKKRRDEILNSKGIDRYNTFGLRLEWIKILFEEPESFWSNERMGTKMFCSFKHWGEEVGLLTPEKKFVSYFNRLVLLGYDSVRLWGFFWVNAAYNSPLVEIFVRNVGFDSPVDTGNIKELMSNTYRERTKRNALTALLNTFRQSPIGNELGQGICELKGNSVISITRTTWSNPEPLVILYSLFLFAEHSDQLYRFTLSHLLNDSIERKALSPKFLFGLDANELRPLLQGLADEFPDFIAVNFNKAIMENIFLNAEKNAAQVINLFSDVAINFVGGARHVV